MSEHNPEIKLELFANRNFAIGISLLWLYLVLVGLVMVGAAILGDFQDQIFARLVLIIIGSAIFFAPWTMLRRTFEVMFAKAPVIEISRNGFLDRRICELPVPWTALEWLPTYGKTTYIQLEVQNSHTYMRQQWPTRFSAALARKFGYFSYTVSPSGTVVSMDELIACMTLFKPPLTRQQAYELFHATREVTQK